MKSTFSFTEKQRILHRVYAEYQKVILNNWPFKKKEDKITRIASAKSSSRVLKASAIKNPTFVKSKTKENFKLLFNRTVKSPVRNYIEGNMNSSLDFFKQNLENMIKSQNLNQKIKEIVCLKLEQKKIETNYEKEAVQRQRELERLKDKDHILINANFVR